MIWFAALALASDTPPFDIHQSEALRRQHCAKEFPDDFSLQETCLQMEIAGMADFKRASDSVGRPLDQALEKCVEEFTDDGVPAWTLIGTCATMQADAYRKLHPAR